LKRRVLIYIKSRGTEKPITGEQKAFNKQEVVEALSLLGYQVVSVNKKLIDTKGKPSSSDILMFVKVAADMLEEKMSYGEILSFLIQDTRNKTLKRNSKRNQIKILNRELTVKKLF
jgi:type IV pilus assembly protein PilC